MDVFDIFIYFTRVHFSGMFYTYHVATNLTCAVCRLRFHRFSGISTTAFQRRSYKRNNPAQRQAIILSYIGYAGYNLVDIEENTQQPPYRRNI